MGARKREALEQFNKDNILTAARTLFDSKGVEKTTMDDIAELADYSKSTIYVYFKSKEDIYNSIVVDYMGILTGELETSLAGDMNFEESYYKLCHCLVNFQEKYPKYYASLLGEEKITNSRKKLDLTDSYMNSELKSLIEQLLQKGKQAKVLRKDIELQPTVLYVWSSISGIIQVAERKKDEIKRMLHMEKEEYLQYAFKTFLESLIRR